MTFMKPTQLSTFRLKPLVELLAYLAFASTCAWLGKMFVDWQDVVHQVTMVRKSPSDAQYLRRSLNLHLGEKYLVEVMDFQCPPCQQAWPKLKSFLLRNHEVRYISVNFPLQIHQYAFPAAMACEVARKHGFHDEAFDDFLSGRVGIDKENLNRYLQRHKISPIIGTKATLPYENAVRKDLELCRALKVQGTPTLLIVDAKGVLSEVQSFDALDHVLR